MRRIAIAGCVAALAACGNSPQPQDEIAIARAAEVPGPELFGATPCEDGADFSDPDATKPADTAAKLRATYARSCGACHGNPASGAPLAHDAAAWAPRLERGPDALLANTVSGIGGMPPMGLCMDCSEAQFRALIEFMAAPEPSK